MTNEGNLEQSNMEENTSKILEQGIEPPQTVNEKEIEKENNVKDEEQNTTESKKENEIKEKDTSVVVEEKKIENEAQDATSPTELQNISSFKEESNVSSDLIDSEKKALSALRSKLEEAILQNKLFLQEKKDQKERSLDKDKKEEKEKTDDEGKEETEGKEGKEKTENEGKEEKEKTESEGKEEETTETAKTEDQPDQQKPKEEEKANEKDKEDATKEIIKQERETEAVAEHNVDQDISIWGVPLLPSKGDNRTDTVLLKFLRAREFKVNDAFEMLRNTLKWRKENKIDSILNEAIEADLRSMTLMEGHDRNGHPVCYNFFSVLGNESIYGKTFEEKREKFMRGRIQIMEKGIQKLDFKPGGVSAILQISDLKNTPLPTKKELRTATKKAVELLQDNYPEFVAKNIFINVPFWYYAYSALFSPSLSQRTKSKIVYARTARVTDTLLKYIPASQIPVQYGGLKRESDLEFSVQEDTKDAIVKAGSEEIIELPAPEAGKTLVWDIAVSGWEVNYKEEFVPSDAGSYTVIISKGRRISFHEGTIRNSFTNKEAGKVVITIENGAFKKKRILYRFKTRDTSSSSS